MGEWPEHNPYPTEAARQRAITARLVLVIAVLGGMVAGLLAKGHLGW
jgi:hypothetical protein